MILNPFGWKSQGRESQEVRESGASPMPVVLNEAEVDALLAALAGVQWLMAMLLYGAGLRLREVRTRPSCGLLEP